MDLQDIGASIRIAFIYFTIVYLTGLGGLFSERSGIVNIGLEGLMVVGTVSGAAGVALFAGPTEGLGLGAGGVVLGLLFGALCGALFASVHAVATINFRVDHIVSGVVINLVAVGLARFLSFVFFEQATQSDPGGPHLSRFDIPLLSDIPGGLGVAFQNLSPVVIFAALLVFPVTYVLYRTRWGLRLRSAGENPEATRSLGVAVAPLRWQGVLLSGALAGLAGGFLSVEVVGNWREGLILSNWDPRRLMVVAFLFGFALAIPLRLDDAPVISALPDQFINMIPYVVTIVAIAGFVGRVRPPAAAGRAYEGAGGG
jgi:simple sugar transport system permease protein